MTEQQSAGWPERRNENRKTKERNGRRNAGDTVISFEKLILNDSEPIYAQIVRFVKRGIVAETIQDGEEMPSRRVLSATLGVNPNTIQKAYRILEEEGIIRSHAGAKSFVQLDSAAVSSIRAELIESEIGALIGAMQQSGVSKEEALSLMQRLWKE